jgi:DNA-directed RNA polymerase specialized sigma subunit
VRIQIVCITVRSAKGRAIFGNVQANRSVRRLLKWGGFMHKIDYSANIGIDMRDWFKRAITEHERVRGLMIKLDELKGSVYRTNRRGVSLHNYGAAACFEDDMIKLFELESELKTSLSRLRRTRAEIERAIERIGSEKTKTILRRRYLDYKEWNDIAKHCGVGVRSVYRIHNTAMKKRFLQ